MRLLVGERAESPEPSNDASADGPHTEKNVIPGGLGCNGNLGSLTAMSEDRRRGRNDVAYPAIICSLRPPVITGHGSDSLFYRQELTNV